MADTDKMLRYTAEPTARLFHADNSLYRILEGPVGCGKTAASVMELLMRGMQQEPYKGERLTRWGVIRSCFDDETEILTDNGWKLFRNLDKTESVAMLQNNELVFVKPTFYYTAPYKGEMICFENEGISMCVTPDHKVYASQMRTRQHLWSDYEFHKAEDIYGSMSWRFKRDAAWRGETPRFSVAMFEWLGFWFAEGSINTNVSADGYTRRRITITQCRNKRLTLTQEMCGAEIDDNIVYTRNLFESAEIPWNENERPDGGINFVVDLDTWDRGNIGTELYELLGDCGKAVNKKIPEWVKNAPREHLNAFIDGFLEGDGNYGVCTTGYTSSKQMADDLQEIALRAGRVVNISSRDRRGVKMTINGVDTTPTAIEYILTFISPSKYEPRIKKQGYANKYRGWYKKDYDGFVYCLEVPTHVVYVRRRGRGYWSSQTYPELKSTTIKTFQQWIPESMCPIVYDVPIRGKLRQPMHDGTILDMEFVFLALESEEDIKKLLSFELTGFLVNEIRELPKEVFDYMRGRIPRYPPIKASEGFMGATWSGIIGDTNPPKVGHWLHELFNSEEGVPEGFKLFKYPPAVYFDSKTQTYQPNPDAENLRNLDPNYYKNQIAGNSETYIRNMLMGEYGIIMHGKPVFPQFSQQRHVAKAIIRPDRGLPLILAWDFGLNPACIFMQLSRRGKLYIVDELAPADEDLESFCQDYVMPLVNSKYNGYQVQCVGDPAARGRSGLDKRTAFDVLGQFGLRLTLAPTNAFAPRKEAVDYFLNRVEGLQVSPHCTYLIEGFSGGYVYEKMKNSMAGSVRYKEKAEKNQYSHGMDAVQYGCLYVMKGSGVQRAGRMLNGMGNDKKSEKKFLWV